MNHVISLENLQLALASAKLRRFTNRGTCLMAAYTVAPLLQSDCSDIRRHRMRDDAMRSSQRRALVSPMGRGHMSELIARTRMRHGLAEVRKTWGTGLRALQAEPRHVLNGGAA